MSETTGKIKQWQLILAPASACIPTMFIILLTFASYVATGVYGVSTVLAGYIITGTRVFDAITDPLIGLWCDRFESKWGRARPLTIIGWAIMSVSVFAMFKLGLGAGLGKLSVLVFILIYLVYILGYTIFNIGSGLVQPIMGKNLKDRAILARGQTVYTTVLSSTISMILAATLMPKHNYKMGLPLFADLCVMVILASAVLIAITYIAVTTSGTDVMASYKGMSKDPIKMKDALDLVLHNRDMQMYTIAAASDKLALQTASNSAITVMIFGIIIGNYKFNASLNLVNMFVTLALLFFFVSRLAGKSGLKKANILWTSTSIAMYALMWVFLLCVDTLQITVNPVLKVAFIVLYCAMGASKMATSCVSNPLRYDIIDYEFSRSGRYMPALVNTVYSFIDKLISSLASTIVALSVAMIGYTEGMPQATDELTSGVFWVGTFLWLGVPIIGYVCTLVAMRWYKLDKETMDEVQRKNAELRAVQKDAK
jgi:GPH family glycoside/pentoside/hexuronide:cation symporter